MKVTSWITALAVLLVLTPAFGEESPEELEAAPSAKGSAENTADTPETALDAETPAAEQDVAEPEDENPQAEESIQEDPNVIEAESQEQNEEVQDTKPEPEADETVAEEPPPEDLSCRDRCLAACGCWNKRGGGGFFVMLLFNGHDSPYGSYSGPSVWFGGRGYSYLGENNEWRVGGLGAGGYGKNGRQLDLDHEIYPISASRSIAGGFGGFTAEYVLNANNTVEFPIGALLGGGGASFKAELKQEGLALADISTYYEKNGGFLAFMPMIGAEANITNWFRATINFSYLLTEPFGSNAHLVDGFTMMIGLAFGHFFEAEFEM